MHSALTDQALLSLLGGTAPSTIDGVIEMMQTIDATLPDTDGLKWFNSLYLLVTKEILEHPPSEGWADVNWITRLDVVFAGFYFAAIAGFLRLSLVPRSWAAVFEARHRMGIDRIQFALSGMNAHINHDLPLALLQTDDEFHLVPSLNSPQHDDFEHVNDLLEDVLPSALELLATGIVGQIAQDSGKIGKFLAIWNVRVARDVAWGFTDQLRALEGVTREIALETQDRLTGALGRSLLLSA